MIPALVMSVNFPLPSLRYSWSPDKGLVTSEPVISGAEGAILVNGMVQQIHIQVAIAVIIEKNGLGTEA